MPAVFYPDDHRDRRSKCIAYERWKSENADAAPLGANERPHRDYLQALRVEAYFAARADAGARDAQSHSEPQT